MKDPNKCSCGSDKDYLECCGRFIEKLELPTDDPEEVLRSRFTSYARRKAQYLVMSWDERYAPKKSLKQIEKENKQIVYTKLEVEDKQIDGDTAKIAYTVRYRVGTQFFAERMVSNFEKIDGHWIYTNDFQG